MGPLNYFIPNLKKHMMFHTQDPNLSELLGLNGFVYSRLIEQRLVLQLSLVSDPSVKSLGFRIMLLTNSGVLVLELLLTRSLV